MVININGKVTIKVGFMYSSVGANRAVTHRLLHKVTAILAPNRHIITIIMFEGLEANECLVT